MRMGIIPRENYQTELQTIRKESDANTIKVLTEEQQKQFEKMKGKEFEMRGGIQLRALPLRIEIRAGKAVPLPRKAKKP